MKILFLSSANLTTNPRLLKELKFAVEQKHEVHFIGFNLATWSDEIDKNIIQKLDAKFEYISVTREKFLPWLVSSLKEKVAQKTYPFNSKKLKNNAFAHSKRSYLLCKHLQKKQNENYDLIVAHTLPTLYPAYKFAQKTGTKFTFDIEDYHPGEQTNIDAENEKKRREFLMKNLLPEANFVTYASPLIGMQSLKLTGNKIKNHKLINNCFSEKEFQFQENSSKKVKFVWFSQNIAAGRGLELVLPALEKHKNKVELHLIGNLYQNFYDDFLSKYAEIVKIHEPLSQKELNLKLSKFDIGLAIELNTADFNRQICLTNKIWAYMQSGLFVLATDTLAQIQFLGTHKNIGFITKQNVEDFSGKIEKILENIEQIRISKMQRFENAKKYAWENEKLNLANIW